MRREDLRPSTQKRAIVGQRKLEKRLTKGEKRNSKRMATVAAVYTIEPFVRTAQQAFKVLKLFYVFAIAGIVTVIGYRRWANCSF